MQVVDLGFNLIAMLPIDVEVRDGAMIRPLLAMLVLILGSLYVASENRLSKCLQDQHKRPPLHGQDVRCCGGGCCASFVGDFNALRPVPEAGSLEEGEADWESQERFFPCSAPLELQWVSSAGALDLSVRQLRHGGFLRR